MLTLLLALALTGEHPGPVAHPSCHCKPTISHRSYVWSTTIRTPEYAAVQTCTVRWHKPTYCTVQFLFVNEVTISMLHQYSLSP